jgi:hypothetical protein
MTTQQAIALFFPIGVAVAVSAVSLIAIAVINRGRRPAVLESEERLDLSERATRTIYDDPRDEELVLAAQRLIDTVQKKIKRRFPA